MLAHVCTLLVAAFLSVGLCLCANAGQSVVEGADIRVSGCVLVHVTVPHVQGSKLELVHVSQGVHVWVSKQQHLEVPLQGQGLTVTVRKVSVE